MLENTDLGKTISEKDFDSMNPELEARLGRCQRAARELKIPVIILFDGWDAAGKGNAIGALAQVLDPRGFKVRSFLRSTAVERMWPWMWRYWQVLPAAGSWVIFDRSWYDRALFDKVGNGKGASPPRAVEDIRDIEHHLVESGAVLIKFWLHIDKKEQRKRFRRLKENTATAWKVTPESRRQNRDYDEWLAATDAMLEATSTVTTPCTVVAATERRYVRFKVLETIVGAVEREIERRRTIPAPLCRPMPEPDAETLARKTLLDRVDLSRKLEPAEYRDRLGRLQAQLFELEHELYVARVPAVIVYEGWDAAGKGGNIRRLTRALDPRGYEVVPVGPPTEEEKSRPYLWRFWRAVPKAGHITIFDRSWYGRVLVERVEGYCCDHDWQRAYGEINEFERQLADFGAVIVKFWLHIDRDEQLRRFEARQGNPEKQWKITEEDWRNREKWDLYRVALDDMIAQTSTARAPWTIIEANDKLHARVKALQTVADTLEQRLRQK